MKRAIKKLKKSIIYQLSKMVAQKDEELSKLKQHHRATIADYQETVAYKDKQILELKRQLANTTLTRVEIYT